VSDQDDNILANFDNAVIRMEVKVMRAMEAAMIEIVNYVKENGPWHDRTGNLRNSISYKAPEKQGDGSIKGIIFAGMEYAIYVEYCAGYWVLGGAFEEYRHRFLGIIKEKLNSL
jgi:hypothetical protein